MNLAIAHAPVVRTPTRTPSSFRASKTSGSGPTRTPRSAASIGWMSASVAPTYTASPAARGPDPTPRPAMSARHDGAPDGGATP